MLSPASASDSPGSLRVGEILQKVSSVVRRHDRGQPLPALSDVDDLAPASSCAAPATPGASSTSSSLTRIRLRQARLLSAYANRRTGLNEDRGGVPGRAARCYHPADIEVRSTTTSEFSPFAFATNVRADWLTQSMSLSSKQPLVPVSSRAVRTSLAYSAGDPCFGTSQSPY